MNLDEAADLTRDFEGLVLEVYLDTEQVPTAGYGHAFHVGSKIPLTVANGLFRQDFIGAIEDYALLNLDLDGVRRAVITDMLFNLGLNRFLGFKKLMVAVRIEDWETASKEMLDSKWAKQVKSRAIKLAEMMKTGEK